MEYGILVGSRASLRLCYNVTMMVRCLVVSKTGVYLLYQRASAHGLAYVFPGLNQLSFPSSRYNLLSCQLRFSY